MEQVRSREAIRAEGKRAAREGKKGSHNPYPQNTEARKEWSQGFVLERRALQPKQVAA
ncbi:hypothetical protein [Cupriavidus yeoncheonensis]|uniref:hypothetical protein n=1 Tax=Cupriavidus yeoncheonensis TaxID=1462994 RepID=UPI001BA8FC44|nr:hypothetical protein [Cupriavidus yeoncheonensis]